jgi:hypothetical protein
MRRIIDFKSKYFICDGNNCTIYRKVNNKIFIPKYNHYHGIIHEDSFYYFTGNFDEYPDLVVKYITTKEKSLILNKKLEINDIRRKYFV